MDYQTLYESVLYAYQQYHIQVFPIDCFQVLRQQGYRIIRYNELSQQKRYACRQLSYDACMIGNTLYYEPAMHPGRTRFSIAHELGHLILSTDDEDDADEFASHFLAPRILIHKHRMEYADQIHDTFGLSYTASNYALSSYRNWYLDIAWRRPVRQPTEPELLLEQMEFQWPTLPPRIPRRNNTRFRRGSAIR